MKSAHILLTVSIDVLVFFLLSIRCAFPSSVITHGERERDIKKKETNRRVFVRLMQQRAQNRNSSFADVFLLSGSV